MTMPTAMYTPTFDAVDRRDYGIKKHRKHPSTGGGRAWSEDEVCSPVVYTSKAGRIYIDRNHIWYLLKKFMTNYPPP